MIEFITSLFEYDFMRHAFYAGTLSAILSGIVGYFVMIRRLSFAAHALGHIGFAGASGGILIGLAPMFGQLGLTLLAAIAIGMLGDKISKHDKTIGIILSFSLGLGTLFLTLHGGYAGSAMVILFGNLFGVSNPDLFLMAWLTVMSLLVLSIFSKPLLFASLEPELASAKGISLFWLSLLFVLILATAVTLASQVVGVILVFTLIIGPAAIASQITRDFWGGVAWSVALAVLLVWTSIILAFVSDWPISFWMSSLVFAGYLISHTQR